MFRVLLFWGLAVVSCEFLFLAVTAWLCKTLRAGAGAGSGFGALVTEGVSGGGASRVMGSRAMVVFAASAQHYQYATRAMFVTLNASPT